MVYDAASSNSRLEDGKEDGLQNVENVGNQRKTPGGEGGIRTLGTGVSPYNGLANRRIRPLCHLSGLCGATVYHV